ncbi:SDR family oxidoreductase [Billgrantia gudaonensis]|uniref:SDR family oxidoreductase n=1 Tax=Billgrantia gudaonensis TaxID=376427 RepID=A0A432JIC9_9GAMM|nr:SDR family oxidoreductase [Halomonas gudaonensis]
MPHAGRAGRSVGAGGRPGATTQHGGDPAHQCLFHQLRADEVDVASRPRVSGAGLYQHLSLAEIGEADWRKSMAINLDGVFFTIQALRPLLSEDSSIVNIASLAGQRGSLNHTPYAAAKAAC